MYAKILAKALKAYNHKQQPQQILMPRPKFNLLQWTIKLAGQLPLPLLHFIGGIIGWISYFFSPKVSVLTKKNLWLSGLFTNQITYRQTLNKNITETGKGILETFAIWQRSEQTLMSWVRSHEGWPEVVQAINAGKGIIFLTPHLGCFEITSLFYSFKSQQPITVLYRPPRQQWLLPFIIQGRARGQVQLAPTTSQGIRDILRALKHGEAVGILPDQIPGSGDGEWAPFFGRPAYTMTFASRLAEKTGAAVFMVFGKRLPWGRGFHVSFTRLTDGCINTPEGLNREIETQVKQCPEQYLWNYHRFKVRRGTEPSLSGNGA